MYRWSSIQKSFRDRRELYIIPIYYSYFRLFHFFFKAIHYSIVEAVVGSPAKSCSIGFYSENA